jgi:hypothetical protein
MALTAARDTPARSASPICDQLRSRRCSRTRFGGVEVVAMILSPYDRIMAKARVKNRNVLTAKLPFAELNA